MKPKRIYLASPYTSDDAWVREMRYEQACKMAAELMKAGDLVFSPIAHSHPLSECDLPMEFEFWKEWCLSFLTHWATHLYVFPLYGWENSKGVGMEIQEAKSLGLPIAYLGRSDIVE